MKTQYDIIATGISGAEGTPGPNGKDITTIPLNAKNGQYDKHKKPHCTPAKPGSPGINASVNGGTGNFGTNGKDAYFFTMKIDSITIQTENPLLIYAKGGNGGHGGKGGNGGKGGQGQNAGVQAKKCSSSIGAEPGGHGGSGSRAGNGGQGGNAGNGGHIYVTYKTGAPQRNQYVKGFTPGGDLGLGGNPGKQGVGGKGGLNGTQPDQPATYAPKGAPGGTGAKGLNGKGSLAGTVTIKQTK